MNYLQEFSNSLRPFVAAMLGMMAGYSITYYTSSIFIPPLMTEFGWSGSQVAFLGVVAIFSALCQPIAGRVADRFGVRAAAAIGIFGGPLLYLLMSLQRGPFWQHFVLMALLVALVSTTTAVVVYSRLVAQSFDKARGMALALISCAPSIAGAIAAPILAAHIEADGWRSGFRMMASLVLFAGLLVLALIPPSTQSHRVSAGPSSQPAGLRRDVWGHPALKWLLAAAALTTLSLTLQTAQLKVLLLGLGLDSHTATGMISVFAIGVLVGRIASGVALDFLPTPIVAAVSLTLPGMGLLTLAAGASSPWLVGIGVAVLGASLGAESDVMGYAVMKYFKRAVYSTVLGLIVATIAVSATLGALILSLSLKLTDGYQAFLILAGISSIIGGLLMLRLHHFAPTREAHTGPH